MALTLYRRSKNFRLNKANFTVLRAFATAKGAGLTDQELAGLTSLGDANARYRRMELCWALLVSATKNKRPSTGKTRLTVWVITKAGIAKLKEVDRATNTDSNVCVSGQDAR